jgi:hypothetical protein
VEALWKLIETAAVIPDATGRLRVGTELWRHPRDSAELAQAWQALTSHEKASRFVHPSCLERQRSSRLNTLAERFTISKDDKASAKLRVCEAESWFRAVASADPDTAIAVLKLAEVYAGECKSGEWNTVRLQLAIVPSESGQLLTASQVVLAPGVTAIPGRETVASALHRDTEARRILAEVMKVQPPNDTVWEQVLNESLRNFSWYPSHGRDHEWKRFWEILRVAPVGVRKAFVQEHQSQIHIRRRSGAWVTADHILLPGGLIKSEDTSANQNLLVDETVHGADGAILAEIGVSQIPDGYVVTEGGGSLVEWLQASRRRYKKTHKNSASCEYLGPFSLRMPRGFYKRQNGQGAWPYCAAIDPSAYRRGDRVKAFCCIA